MTYRYVARLCPIDRQLEVIDRDQGRIVEWFDRHTFVGERDHPQRVTVNVDHRNRVAGRLDQLCVAHGWWTACFRLDHTLLGALAEDLINEGARVSIGFDPIRTVEMGESGIVHYQLARLNEVSVVADGAYEGATVISKIPIRTPRRSTAARSTAPDEPPWLRQAREAAAARGNLVRVFDSVNVRIT